MGEAPLVGGDSPLAVAGAGCDLLDGYLTPAGPRPAAVSSPRGDDPRGPSAASLDPEDRWVVWDHLAARLPPPDAASAPHGPGEWRRGLSTGCAPVRPGRGCTGPAQVPRSAQVIPGLQQRRRAARRGVPGRGGPLHVAPPPPWAPSLCRPPKLADQRRHGRGRRPTPGRPQSRPPPGTPTDCHNGHL